MAARKSTRTASAPSSGSARKSPKKKAARKKKAAAKKRPAPAKTAKPAKKKASGRKAASKKKAGAAKKAAARSDEPAPTASEPATRAAAASAAPKPKKSGSGTVSVRDVTLGHVFALRPRVNTSFRPNDFMQAKRTLREETFSSLDEAARALAEEALAATRRTAARPNIRRRG